MTQSDWSTLQVGSAAQKNNEIQFLVVLLCMRSKHTFNDSAAGRSLLWLCMSQCLRSTSTDVPDRSTLALPLFSLLRNMSGSMYCIGQFMLS